MKVLYNEINEYRAIWLRNLMDAGEIPLGDVDTRRISELDPDFVGRYHQCHFFAGIGGWAYAARLADWPADQPLWTGSCPCQPFSGSNQADDLEKGFEDDRHEWPNFARLITACRPPLVVGEQVASPAGNLWIDRVQVELANNNYASWAVALRACGVGAPHQRKRYFWLGYSVEEGLERFYRYDSTRHRETPAPGLDSTPSVSGSDSSGLAPIPLHERNVVYHPSQCRIPVLVPGPGRMEEEANTFWDEYDLLPFPDGWRRVQPGTFPVVDGVSRRMEQIEAYGDAIVPQLGAAFLRAIY